MRQYDETTVRRVIGMFVRVAAMPPDFAARKGALLDELCELTSSHGWWWRSTTIGVGPPSEELHGGVVLLDGRGPSLRLARLVEGGKSEIGLGRLAGEPDYKEQESRLAEMVLGEVAMLHWRTDRVEITVLEKKRAMYPREREALELLVHGLPRKGIADRMNVSTGTLAGYVRQVFSRFGVRNQAELVRLVAREARSANTK